MGSKREIQPWLMTKAVTVKPIEVVKQTTVKPPEPHTPPQKYPQTLKIHEILPTTAKYDRLNGKRPALSTASKIPDEVYFDDKSNAGVESSTINTNDIGSTEPSKMYDQEEKDDGRSQNFIETTEKPIMLLGDESTEYTSPSSEIINDGIVSPTGISLEFITESDREMIITSTERSELKSDFEIILTGGPLESKGNLITVGLQKEIDESVVLDGVSETDRDLTLPDSTDSYEDAVTSTESVRIRSVPSEFDPENIGTLDDGSTSPVDTSMSTLDTTSEHTSPNPNVDESETIGPTITDYTYKMDSLILGGGIYDELNDTVFYTDDNDVKQDTSTVDIQEVVSTTEMSPDLKTLDREESRGEVFEKYIESPRSSISSMKRNDNWFSKNFQYVSIDESDDKSTDLNVGATSNSATRVSPSIYFDVDSKENLLSGRSLAPYEIEKNDISFGKTTSEGKYLSHLDSLVTEEPSSVDASYSESEERDNASFDPYERPDLYLSITGKNASSNETILHMILSPRDLKRLAEQIVKENIIRNESNLKETQVNIEWLTQDQLSKLKPASPRVSIDLTKCNFTGLADLDLKHAKLNDRYDSDALTHLENVNGLKSTSSDNVELSTLPSNFSDIFESSTTLYGLTNGAAESTESFNDSSRPEVKEKLKKNNSSLGPETSTIKIYEVIQTDNNADEKITELTTDGPYTGHTITSDSQETTPDRHAATSPRSGSTDADETAAVSTEPATVNEPVEKSSKKNLPDVEPFLRQLPSTLDEKDVSILRDFLEKHLSEPPSR